MLETILTTIYIIIFGLTLFWLIFIDEWISRK
jgi:hypothetical protein